jgi:hypothetical protein
VTSLATVPPTNDGAQLMSMVERFASDPNFDVQKLRAMLDMKLQMEDRAAEQEYNVAMKACQEELRPVVRDRLNTHTRAKYATLEKIHAECKEIWLRHGFSLSSHSDVSPLAGHYRVVTTCRHEGGHKTTHFLDAPPDDAGPKGEKNKTPIQALGSTVSYVRRYLDLMIFDITLVGEDIDGNRPVSRAKISDQQCMEMQAFMDEHNLNPQPFLKWKGVAALGDIPAVDFDDCMRRLRNKAKEAANANR